MLALLACAVLTFADDLDEGRKLLGTKEHAKGVALIQKGLDGLKAQPATAQNRHRLGLGYFWLQDDKSAIGAFSEAAKLDPKSAEHPFMVGIVWMYSDLAKATEWLLQAAKLDPKSAKIQFEIGRVARNRKQPEAALKATLRACELDPAHVGARVQAGGLLVAMKRPKEALVQFEAAIALEPNNAMALYNAGQLHYDAKQFDKALERWAAGATAQPDDYGFHKKAIQACYALGKLKQSEPHKAALRRLRAAAPPEKRAKDYCFDQFDAGTYRVLAYETFDTKGDFVLHLVFRVYDGEQKLVRTVNLESSAVIRSFGTKFCLGGYEGEIHRNYGVGYKEMPAYADLKRVVIDAAVDGKLGK